jgi:ATP-binding cassette, subfamily C (CFTR/MRP), member 1
VIDNSQRPFYLMYMIQKWLSLVLDIIITAMAVLVVGISVALRDSISPGFTGVSLTQIITFTTYLKMMILFWTQMETCIGAVARIKDFSTETEQEDSPPGSLDLPLSWPASGHIEARDVTLSYKYVEPFSSLRRLKLLLGTVRSQH